MVMFQFHSHHVSSSPGVLCVAIVPGCTWTVDSTWPILGHLHVFGMILGHHVFGMILGMILGHLHVFGSSVGMIKTLYVLHVCRLCEKEYDSALVHGIHLAAPGVTGLSELSAPCSLRDHALLCVILLCHSAHPASPFSLQLCHKCRVRHLYHRRLSTAKAHGGWCMCVICVMAAWQPTADLV